MCEIDLATTTAECVLFVTKCIDSVLQNYDVVILLQLEFE